jgi:3-hydroxybutyryl-CoA dehydrogenase
MNKIAVIGAGTMGSGIAQVAATAGCLVKLFDTFPDSLSRSKNNLDKALQKLEEKGKITQDEVNRIAGNISYVNTLTELADAELIIEAIVENIDVKRILFSDLEKIVSKSCILASNWLK